MSKTIAEYANIGIKAKVEMLNIPLDLDSFQPETIEGVEQERVLMTIPEFLLTLPSPHTVERFSTDGYFFKMFPFNRQGLKELEAKFAEFGLVEGENVFILLSPNEIAEELAKDIWNSEEANTI